MRRLISMKNLDKKRWMIVIASCIINLCIGSLYTWSVFAGPLAEKFSQLGSGALQAANLAIIFMVANSVGPITMIAGGHINDRLGPKWVVILGGVFFGGGMFLTGLVSSVTMAIFTYGIFVGLGMGLVYGCTISNSVKFFPDKKGLIGGITTASYGLSSVLMPPIENYLIENYGISTTFKSLGLIFLTIIVIGAFFIQKCPLGYSPEGYVEKNTLTLGENTQYTWQKMLLSKDFYLMILMLLCGAFSGLMITSQVSNMGQKIVGVIPAVAAVVVSILALFNSFGRIMAGYLSDRFGRINVIRFVFLLEILGLILLILTKEGQLIIFVIGISIMGICFGSLMGIYPGFTADRFGMKNNSVNYGIMFIGFALAGIFGPKTASQIFLGRGSYVGAFVIAAILALIGILLATLFKKQTERG